MTSSTPPSEPLWEPARSQPEQFGLTNDPERVVVVGAQRRRRPTKQRPPVRKTPRPVARAARKRGRAASKPVPGAQLIGLPRLGSVLAGLIALGTLFEVLFVLNEPIQVGVGPLTVLLPLLLAIGVVGVAPLPGWWEAALRDWGRPLVLVCETPYVIALMVSLANTSVKLPLPVMAAVAVVAVIPFFYSALGVGRIQPAYAPRPSSQGRRGIVLAAVVLMLIVFSIARPDFGAFVEVLLAVALVVGAFLARGIADAAATWPVAAWWALLWGSAMVWLGTVASGQSSILDSIRGPVVLVAAAGLPLLLTALLGRRRAA